ncbi:MAG: S-layer homology domain-containing protein [Firmicutes bacterium]|nr:S-layer homology domain-containing protein [Bacillota bacterium]
MRKRMLTLLIFCLLLLPVCLGAAGSASDPLITQSWLENYLDSQLSPLEKELDALQTEVNKLSSDGIEHFTDLGGYAWAEQSISFVVKRGLFNGTTDTTFAPGQTMSRAMFVTVLGRLAGADPASYTDATFKDVPQQQYYAPYVAWAVKNGIIGGYTDGTFRPDAPITREQLAVCIIRYADYAAWQLPSGSSITFADASKISSYATASVQRAVQAGIVGGYGDSTFRPQGQATRAEAATMLMRLVNAAN